MPRLKKGSTIVKDDIEINGHKREKNKGIYSYFYRGILLMKMNNSSQRKSRVFRLQ